jgi:zinc protease
MKIVAPYIICQMSEILDRKLEPVFKVIDKIEIVKADKKTLSNGIPVYAINAGEHELVKVDIIFDAGEWMQKTPMLSYSVVSMLCEGSLFHNAEEIAEKFDFLGSYIYYNTQKHTATITIYSLQKHLEETLQLIEEIIKYPLFPEKEFETFNNKRKQQYTIDSQKVELIAQKHFCRALFGNEHPYGMYPELDDFDKITTMNIRSFHAQYFIAENCKIIIAGKINESHILLLNRYLGDIDWQKLFVQPILSHKIKSSTQKQIIVEKKDAVQSAIRIGKMTINKFDPDFPKLQIVNTILGGYFGSRLMSNIREDKGYTYGIGSGLVSYKNAGYFVIASEVGKNVTFDAIKEVYLEIEKLQTELVSENELEVVRNYMLGNVLRNFDGPFALSDTLKTILEYDLGYEYFETFVETLKSITPNQIKSIAVKHLEKSSLYEIIAG